jgi:acetyl-CoA synthetase
MLKPARSYEEACRTFRWRIPERYNLAFDLCDRQTLAGADGHRTALVVDHGNGRVDRFSFIMLKHLSNRVCNMLVAQGVGPGDRVLVSLPASVEAAALLLSIPRMGAVLIPVPVATPVARMVELINQSDARFAVVDRQSFDGLMDLRPQTSCLNGVIVCDQEEARGGGLAHGFWSMVNQASDRFAVALTRADDAAFLFYPLGEPCGILHAHRAVPGNLPAIEFALGFFAQAGDVLWTSWDWMSFEGLLWAIMPAWHYGVPVVASSQPYDPEQALAVMAEHGVRAVIMPPDHLSALTQTAFKKSHSLPRAIASGPDPLPLGLHQAIERAFGVTANEVWGTCRSGALAANNAALMELRIGSPGKVVPGIVVETVDFEGEHRLGAGQSGLLSAAPNTPGACLGLWGPSQVGLRVAGGWFSSGWSGSRDLDGYLWPDFRPGADIPIPAIPAVNEAIPGLQLDGLNPRERW